MTEKNSKEKTAGWLVQPAVNVGTAGHVDHGKTTLVSALTGEWTGKHSEEIKRGITIRLGYADASVFHCKQDDVFSTKPECASGHAAEFVRKISFVDCPGHESLMTVMISGASLMDGAFLVIAANEPCPQQQTFEHLQALNIAGIKNVVIVQNKVDLVTREQAKVNYAQIKEFVKGTVAENAPIIPIVANYGVNMESLVKAIQDFIPTPKRDLEKDFRMVSAHSFDVNKPGTLISDLKGGVVGGSIIRGKVKEGDEIEIQPGIEIKGKYEPFLTRVSSVAIKDGVVKEAHAGGLVALATLLDPSLTKSDRLIGSLIGKPGSLPKPLSDVRFETHLLKTIKEPIKKGDLLVLNIATSTTAGLVVDVRKAEVEMKLKKPICGDKGDKVVVSKRVGNRWSLVGYGILK